ncbi:thiamine-phosphate kinase [Marinomonas mediterranea]|uniref:Thiamine-monophosphate kinase n=1 Tax=Marinomonas mediterranea (strain ATCC 700492 / JCM 21426 / NBRC 103028 / MMB-1) TaxID=717774 RepID=F2JZL5_MARM1|nr:thiamine-phosphate kinase [Marinomonas mediterranea]ADZ89798.1 thiamine-monophosphate kinase [Marinomonas mediterranea MMB-1]WCN11982.1 thiamine-phosphate kinase [Marinomonas mediterranea]WCN16019.1 thiamine-phosphate kinase [Marinomonas mediterranea MMB-1]
MKEFELIQSIFQASRMADVRGRDDILCGIGDDCAQVKVPANQTLVFSMDTLVEGRHFPFDADPRDIGYRAVASCVSDLAAMGAKPAFFTLGLTLPDSDPQWLAELAAGMAELADQIGLLLVGGDTTKGPLTITLQVHGYVEQDKTPRRSGALVGDDIYVTGMLGDASAAVPIVTGELQVSPERFDYFYEAYWRPMPRLIAGMALKNIVNSMLDISDGLAQDLKHITKASDVGARIEPSKLPLSDALLDWRPEEALRLALTGGDDYELCFTAPKSARDEVNIIMQTLHLPCSLIGEITDSGFAVEGYEGELDGWQHF